MRLLGSIALMAVSPPSQAEVAELMAAPAGHVIAALV